MNKFAISVRDLHKSYKSGEGEFEVLKGVDLEVKKGEFFVVTGVSGSGKSTLLNLLSGLDRPDKGQVFLNDQDIFTLQDRDLVKFRRNRIGFVFQFHHLLPEFTTLENVMMPLLINRLNYKKAEGIGKLYLRKVGLEERIHHRSDQLSCGESQRVAVARALVNTPEYIFADEPTGNLDSENSEEVINLLERLVRENKTTLVLVTHDEDLAKRADRVAKLVNGELTVY
ncbi:MAG: ABC transporter ATP-binding protein [bacterium]|nr:ABC transporter ATP-binding protein [bacterium]